MPAPARRRWVLLFATLSIIATAAPAAAHTDLISTDPFDGQSLTQPPTEVSLRFGENLLSAGDRLVAKDADGVVVGLGETQVTGAVLSATWPASADSGQYRVAYRAVAADGHPLEGSFTFTIKGPKAASATPVPEASPSPASTPAPAEGSGVNPWLPIGLVAALLVAGFFVWKSRAD